LSLLSCIAVRMLCSFLCTWWDEKYWLCLMDIAHVFLIYCCPCVSFSYLCAFMNWDAQFSFFNEKIGAFIGWIHCCFWLYPNMNLVEMKMPNLHEDSYFCCQWKLLPKLIFVMKFLLLRFWLIGKHLMYFSDHMWWERVILYVILFNFFKWFGGSLFAGQNIRKLFKDGFIIRKPTKIHSCSRARRTKEAKRKGRHSGYGI